MIPAFGIIDAYGGFTSEYYNALGFFVLCEWLRDTCWSSLHGSTSPA